MFAMFKREQAMLHRSNRIAGAFHNHINPRMRDKRTPIVTDKRVAVFDSVIKRGCLRTLMRPSHAHEVRSRSIRRQIRNAHQMHTRRTRHLRKIHRAEFARTNKADANGVVVSGALFKFCVEIHWFPASTLSPPLQGEG